MGKRWDIIQNKRDYKFPCRGPFVVEKDKTYINSRWVVSMYIKD
jgi:hypothetical protein